MFELRPAHDPTKAYGFVNAVISLKDLSASIWTWYRDGDKRAIKKVIEIPAEAADALMMAMTATRILAAITAHSPAKRIW